MKKFLFITIAILVIVSILCFAAFANEEKDISSIASNSNSASIGVYAKTTSDKVYYVSVEFEDLEFTYNSEWTFDENNNPIYTPGTWESDSNMIIVTNKSNCAVNISFSYTSSEDFNGITGKFAEGEENGETFKEKSNSIINAPIRLAKYDSTEDEWVACSFLKLSGETDKLVKGQESILIGTVTVTASAVE